MSNTNDFLPFCPEDTGTNLEEQSAYLVDNSRTIGNQPGIASSKLNNKAIRQATYVASQFAQYVSNQANVSVLDNGVGATFLSQIQAALQPLAPVLTSLLSGTGTWNPTYYFFVASANATAGATYTNNSQTFTVVNTISGGTLLMTTGTGAPTTGGGTLALASGTGDNTITAYAFRSALFLEVEMSGAGGGAGAAPSTATGTSGTASTFGTSLLSAGGGAGGSSTASGGVGGTATINSPAVSIFSFAGTIGECSSNGNPACIGGSGGSNLLGGAGQGGSPTLTAGPMIASTPGVPNSGGGGGGGGGISGSDPGSGGGGGAYLKAFIASVVPYAYSVGVGGSGVSSTTVGSDGGSGIIIVREFFQ